MNVQAQEGDTIDDVVYRTFGHSDATDDAIKRNPTLILKPYLNEGDWVTLTHSPIQHTKHSTIKLWD